MIEVRPVLRRSALLLLLASLPRAALAQDAEASDPFAQPEPEAEPPAESGAFPRADPDVSDSEVIRWAARELSRADGRAVARRPPVPPDPYLGHGPRPAAEVSPAVDDGIRLLAELGGGTLGVLLGGGAGALLVWAAVEADANPDWMMMAGAAGGVLGAFGVTAGVTLAADATGGRANFGHAFIGQAIGSVAAVPFVVLGLSNDAPAAAFVAAGLLPVAGAVLGYELAHGLATAGDGGDPVVAWVAPIRDGAMGGVAGEL